MIDGAIKKVTNEAIASALNAIQQSHYGSENDIILDVFEKHKENVNRDIVAMKIALIDVTNSTHLHMFLKDISFQDLITTIVESDFDNRVKNGDITLVEELAKWTKTNGKNLFSLISKYCFFHNNYCWRKDDFVIFDGVLSKNIPDYIAGTDYFQLTHKKRKST